MAGITFQILSWEYKTLALTLLTPAKHGVRTMLVHFRNAAHHRRAKQKPGVGANSLWHNIVLAAR
jgi:hypothetical protein